MKRCIKLTIVLLWLLMYQTTVTYSRAECFPLQDPVLKAAADLISRVIPGYSGQFKLEIIESEDGKDVFEVDRSQERVCLRGNNPVAIASALNWYLKYTCNAHFSWCGNQLDLPEVLPLPEKKSRIVFNAQYRVYLNYCTFNYSASWWDWDRWQREIDFMAMNGINMPLSVTGLEGVWYHALLRFGYSDQAARSFLAGPAFLAWQWMTNIQSHGGPLPKNWIDTHIVLGKKIIQRELALGMKPIQQGFSGCVPLDFIEKFPDADIRQKKSWGGFEGTAQLDPLDPLFREFGRVFMEEQKRLFGAHGIYAADPFHEGHPPLESAQYLNRVGKAIHTLMDDFDPGSLWVMMAWSIRKDIVSVVSRENLLILDLGGSKWRNNENFWGYDFIVGSLHNFGGRINMHGDLERLASNKYAGAVNEAQNAVGSGLFMEGIGQNPVYYDLAFEMAFHESETDLKKWLSDYATRRYGGQSQRADKAWQMLLEGPYRTGTDGVENSSMISARPAIHVKKSGPNKGFDIPYDPQIVIGALQLLLKDNQLLNHSEGYRYDIVDLQRQILTNLGQEIHKHTAAAYTNKDLEAFDLHSNRFLDMLRDADRLLKTRTEFSFDRWTLDARKHGVSSREKDLYEYNASLLVTQWGGVRFFDYSWREWSGLIHSYYLPRWEQFYSMLRIHLLKGTEYSEEGLPLVFGRERLRANEFYAGLDDWEKEWIKSNKDLRSEPEGDELEIVQELFEKYSTLSSEYYK